MSYFQQANDLGYPLGGVSSFHMIHIGQWLTQTFFLGFSMYTTVKHQICALSAIDRGTFNTFCITTRYAVSSLLYVSSPFLSFVAFIIHQGRLSNCKQDASKNRKQTKTVKILRKELHFKSFVHIKFTRQESELVSRPQTPCNQPMIMFKDQQKNVKLIFKRPMHFTDQTMFVLGAPTSNRLSFVNPGKQILQ